jgi:hypothetical protein
MLPPLQAGRSIVPPSQEVVGVYGLLSFELIFTTIGAGHYTFATHKAASKTTRSHKKEN